LAEAARHEAEQVRRLAEETREVRDRERAASEALRQGQERIREAAETARSAGEEARLAAERSMPSTRFGDRRSLKTTSIGMNVVEELRRTFREIRDANKLAKLTELPKTVEPKP
jgi:hypothetical protein